MAQVLPAERDLRRVIGDGESVPDGEVEGLTDHDLVELYRGLVLLRTYDERSVVYHRQGRIGTYAIYWNHEAMQAGSESALADDDWDFRAYRALRRRLDLPELPRVGDRAPARDAGLHGAFMVARAPVRVVEPGGLQRRLDLRADRDPRAARGRARLGQAAAGRERLCDRLLRRRRDLRGLVPRGRELRRGHARAARLVLQQQRLGDLDSGRGADARRDARGQGGRLRDA